MFLCYHLLLKNRKTSLLPLFEGAFMRIELNFFPIMRIIRQLRLWGFYLAVFHINNSAFIIV